MGWILLVIIIYLIAGIIIANNTSLGKEDFSGYPTSLALLWILPVIGFVLLAIGETLLDICDFLFPTKNE